MGEIIGWTLALLGQVGVFYLFFRFLQQTQRRGIWTGLLILPVLTIAWFGYELFQPSQGHLISAFLAAASSLTCFGLLWFLLPPTKDAFNRYDQLRSEKEEYQLLLEQLPDLVVFKDPGLSYRKVNVAFAKTLGKTIDLLIGRSDVDFFPPKIAQTLEEDEKRAIASKQPVNRQIELMTVKGKRWFELTFTPLIDKLGVTLGILVNGHDLTELIERTHKLEDDLHLKDFLVKSGKRLFNCKGETELWEVLLELMEEIGSTPYVALMGSSNDGESFVVEATRKPEVFRPGAAVRSAGGLFGKITRSGQIQISEDPANWKDVLLGEEGEIFQLAVGVPIDLDNQIRGIITLFYTHSEEEIVERRKEFLVEVAENARLALKDLHTRHEIEQRFARTRRDLEQTTLRQRIDHFLTALAIRLMNAAPRQIDTLLEKAIGSFAEYVGAEKSYVYLFKREGGGLQAQVRWCGSDRLLPPFELPEPFDPALSWLLEKINRQEIVALCRAGDMPAPLQVYFDAQNINFLVAVPMVLRRTVVGYLGIEGNEGASDSIFDQIGAVKAMADIVVNALDRKWSADELEERMRHVSEKISQLEMHNKRNKLLAEMGDLLQSCRTADEAYPIIARYAQILMPDSVGALYLLRTVQDVAEKVAQWGNEPSGENELVLNECWGIRRGKVHLVRNSEGPFCDHLGMPFPDRYICVPLIAQGETIGLLHIRNSGMNEPGNDHLEELSKIGVSIAEHVAPALSNLNLRDKLRSQAIRDPLTGLFNRRYMEETLDREIRRAARHKYSVGLIMCDIDQMKPINDRYGHDAGDVVLRQIGSLMKKIFRGEDVACRYGGDEFMVILPEASLSDVWQRAESLREAVKKTSYEYEGKSIGPITLSIGVAAYPDLGSTVERLIQVSDAAAYLAKHEGGDRVMIAHHTDDNAK